MPALPQPKPLPPVTEAEYSSWSLIEQATFAHTGIKPMTSKEHATWSLTEKWDYARTDKRPGER